jgi:RNase P subunit RPR2
MDKKQRKKLSKIKSQPCHSCKYYLTTTGYCEVREITDMVQFKCADWSPRIGNEPFRTYE